MVQTSQRDGMYLAHMGELMAFHRIVASPEEVSRDDLEDQVMAFQSNVGVLVDGIVGPETLWRLQAPWALVNPKLLFQRCEADVVPGIDGFDSLILREDAADRYRKLRGEVLGLGGVITTAGGRRDLKAEVNQSRSAKSMHYAGLAFDLSLPSAFFKPATDPYVVTRGDDGYWDVWCRASGGEARELSAVYWDSWGSGVDRKKKVKGKFINFTELCREHGFHPIRPRRSFLRDSNRSYTSAEWWHFQANDLLVPELSQFGIELIRIDGYTSTMIERENPDVWGNRKSVYRRDWA